MVAGDRLDFQLFVLKRMIGGDEQIDAALAELGVTRAEMRDVGERVSAGLDLRQGTMTLANVKKLAGEPDGEERCWTNGESGTALFYHFPMWPEFDFKVVGRDGDGLWIDDGFVRCENSEVPHVESPESLQPWKHLVDEVRERFGPLQEGDMWPPYEQYETERRDADGVLRRHIFQFSWGLLQRASVH
ncbi:hypothetical protein [Saccharopolyspora oryzae]|uniref:Uncharacterized protein n=1 Tax=Saccharopolyspora oryzae TaxID=2997343 RepID=A0ABT4UY80_9PSEU|nr:hypothetical protein [Saccharopolyspora oryzae]MDA3626670.1 hypothetical protein [Saccharopolyspora oryzae]